MSRAVIVALLLAAGLASRAGAASEPERAPAALGPSAAGAAPASDGSGADEPPEGAFLEPTRGVDIEEHLGRPVGRELAFTDMDGRRVRLGDYLADGKPLLLVLAYYRCPALCGLVLRGAVEGLKLLPYRLGEHFNALTVSFDPRERPAAASQKRAVTLSELGADAQAPAWPFLVGDEAATRALAEDLGFRYAYDPATDQYAHPAAVFVLTPDGRISRYLYGPELSARDLRLALLEASRGDIGTLVDRVIMTCYRFDPASRRYGPFLLGFLRLGAVAILITVGGPLAVLWWRERRRPGPRTRGAVGHDAAADRRGRSP
ncbi:SCO family protein [Sorangium sp. So ce315]|uniref:SCO family protein n=1 Tax=Sorangium sp. So ce315 TaxID=3133299 RepID=UPI003F6001E5